MEKNRSRISVIYEKFCNAEIVICMILFCIIVSLVFVSAVLRKLSTPIQWSMDISQLCFAWLAFLGGDVALRNGALVGVALVTKKFSKNVQKLIKLICYLLMMVLLIIFIKNGFSLAIQSVDRAFQTLPISYSWVTLSLPVSSVFMFFSIIHNILKINDEIDQENLIIDSVKSSKLKLDKGEI